MLSDPYHLAFDSLPVRPVRRACLALDIVHIGGFARSADSTIARDATVVLDAEQDEFVYVAAPSADRWRVADLATDGRRLLFLRRSTDPSTTVCLYELSTGRQRWLDVELHTDAGALAPDGRQVAVLSSLPDPDDDEVVYDRARARAVIEIVDLDTGQRRRLWTGPQGTSTSDLSAIGWSPDQRFVAAQLLVGPDEEHSDDLDRVVVADASGPVVAEFDTASLMSRSNDTWINERELGCNPGGSIGYGILAAFDVRARSHRILGAGQEARARIGNRLVDQRPEDQNTLTWANVDGSDARPLIVASLPCTFYSVRYTPLSL